MRKYLQIVALAAVLPGSARAADAAQIFEAAEQAARAGDSLRAFLLYSQAAQLDPSNMLYAGRQAALARSTALSRPATLGADPAQETVEAQMREAGELSPEELAEAPPALTPAPGTQNFNLKSDARTLFEKVAGAYGIQVVFDGAYDSASPSITFRITEATAGEPLRALQAASDSFLVPLGPKLAMVARDTVQKRQELTPVMSLAVPIPQRLTVQEAQEIATAAQQTLEIRRISLDAAK